MTDKEAARAAGKSGVPSDRITASQKVVDVLSRSPAITNANQIGLYSPLSWEVDLLAFWKMWPDRVFFPKCFPKNKGMEFHRVSDLAMMEKSSLGILEPKGGEVAQAWKGSDVIFVPGLGFDEKGGRVGSGQGYYDRFLSALSERPKIIGVGWQAQVYSELSQEPFDVSMDGLITESGWVFES